MSTIKYRQPWRLFKRHSYLLLKEPILITIAVDERTTIEVPYEAGLYGFVSIERRDKAVTRFNRTSGLDEIAVPVIPMQV